MICGNLLWSRELTDRLSMKRICERETVFFKNAPTSLYEVLLRSFHINNDKTAIVDADETPYTYEQLLAYVKVFAKHLQHIHGINKGEKVAVVLYNSIEFCVAILALSKIGAVAVSIPGKYRPAEIEALIEKVEVKTILCESTYTNSLNPDRYSLIPLQSGTRFLDSLENACTESETSGKRDLKDPALVFFTSGTTSRSKSVLLRNYNIMHAIASYCNILSIGCEDSALLATPIYNVTGIIGNLGVILYSGGTLYIQKKVIPERMLNSIRNNNITFIHASPTVFHLLISKKDDYPSLPSLRIFVCGSSNMPIDSILKIKKWLPYVSFHTVYGLTESSSPATIFPKSATDSPYLGSSGLPIPGVSIKIIDDHGDEMGEKQLGEICLKGTVIIRQYYSDVPDAFTPDGWFKTGDIGYMNKDGYLWVVDRKKDLINRGGEKICCFDVENAIHQVPGVLEAAVVGIPDVKYGEIPVAVIQKVDNIALDIESIKKYLDTSLAKFQQPAQYKILKKIPKTANGKIDKKSIRLLF